MKMLRNVLKSVLCMLCLCCGCASIAERQEEGKKKILFVSMAVRGHLTPLLRIAQEMAAEKKQKYQLSFASHDSAESMVNKIPRLNFLSAGKFPIASSKLRKILKHISRDPSVFSGILTMMNEVYLPISNPLYNALYDQLSSSKNESKPDLIIMDMATFGAQDLAQKLNIPYIVNSPSLMSEMLSTSATNVPAWGTGFLLDMPLWYRCLNIFFPRLLSVALTPPFMQLNTFRRKLNLQSYQSQNDIFAKARILRNTAFGFEYARPISPLIDMLGPIVPSAFYQRSKGGKGRRKHKANYANLPPLINSWLEGGGQKSDGLIYICLGSMPYLEPWQANQLVQGLAMKEPGDPRFQVLWTLPNDQRSVLPANLPPSFRIKVLGGLPHLKVLAHPAVKLVISHCSLAAAQEALYFNKPLLCLPFFVDQPDVAARVVDAGAGLYIDKTYFSAEEVRYKVLEIYNSNRYSNNSFKVGERLRSSGGIGQAIEVIESVLLLGYDHLKTEDLASSWHKTAMLDVYAVYAAIFCIFLAVLRIIYLCFLVLTDYIYMLLQSLSIFEKEEV